MSDDTAAAGIIAQAIARLTTITSANSGGGGGGVSTIGPTTPTTLTPGSVVFAGASTLAQDNANFFWDSTNHVLSTTKFAVPTGGAFTYNAVNAIVAQTALYNWFVGDSGNLTATGDHNLGFGHLALNALTSGTNNQAIGPSALLLNQSGGGNTAVGISALSAIVSSNNNTAIGYSACRSEEHTSELQ